MEDNRFTDAESLRGREALPFLLVVLLGGALLVVAADRVLQIGATVGNVLFGALPLAAATAAATRLHHDD